MLLKMSLCLFINILKDVKLRLNGEKNKINLAMFKISSIFAT